MSSGVCMNEVRGRVQVYGSSCALLPERSMHAVLLAVLLLLLLLLIWLRIRIHFIRAMWWAAATAGTEDEACQVWWRFMAMAEFFLRNYCHEVCGMVQNQQSGTKPATSRWMTMTELQKTKKRTIRRRRRPLFAQTQNTATTTTTAHGQFGWTGSQSGTDN